MELSPLAKRIISTRGSGGSPLAQLALLQTIAPVVPPFTTFAYSFSPKRGAYAAIVDFFRLSPQMMPGVFNIERMHSGTGVLPLIVSTLVLTEGVQPWMEITANNRLTTIVRNVSPLNQYFEVEDVFLIVSSQDDFHELIASLGKE